MLCRRGHVRSNCSTAFWLRSGQLLATCVGLLLLLPSLCLAFGGSGSGVKGRRRVIPPGVSSTIVAPSATPSHMAPQSERLPGRPDKFRGKRRGELRHGGAKRVEVDGILGMVDAAAGSSHHQKLDMEELKSLLVALDGHDWLLSISLQALEERIEHMRVVFEGANVTSIALRVPTLLQMTPQQLDDTVAERVVQLRTLLPRCRAMRLITKVPSLLVRDFEGQTRVVYDQLNAAMPGLDMGRIMYVNPHLLAKDWERVLKPTLDDLRELFAGRDICRMINKAPNLLSRDVRGGLRVKLESLSEQLPGVDVGELFERQPGLLGRNMTVVLARLEALRAIMPKTDVNRMLKRVPTLLLADTEKVVRPKFQRLCALLSEEGASRLCEAMPTIFNRDLDKIENRITTLTKHASGLDVVKFLERNPLFLRSMTPENEDVAVKVDALQRALPQGVNLTRVLNAEPPLFSEEADVIARKLSEVRRITGLSDAELSLRIERDPRFLATPQHHDGVLLSRMLYLHRTKGQGELQRLNLGSLAAVNVKGFVRLYQDYGHFMIKELVDGGAASRTEADWRKHPIAVLEKVVAVLLWEGQTAAGRVAKLPTSRRRWPATS